MRLKLGYLLVLTFLINHIGISQNIRPYFRIAVLGCHKQFEPAPSLFRYLEAKPDLCLWIGDNVYADTEDDVSYLKKCYAALQAKPAFQQLVTEFPLMATWDDHDFGLNDAGRFYPLKKASKSLFRNFWGLEDQIPETQDGIYYSQTFSYNNKKIQIIMLDVRYNRDLPATNGDVLGAPQWKWLETTLSEPADLKIVVSGFQILLDAESGSETWDNFPAARQRLFDLIKKTQTQNLIFLTGDQHYGEVARLKNALDFDAIELQFAGINQIEKPEFNSYRVSNVITSKHSYAYLDIYFEDTKYDKPHIAFSIFDGLNNERELYYRINLEELQLNSVFPPISDFVNNTEIQLSNPYSDLILKYTLNGSEPTNSSPIYQAPIELSQTTTLKVRYYHKDGTPRSNTTTKSFTKIDPIPSIKKTALENGLWYKYFEGNYTELPKFEDLKPKKEGMTKQVDIFAIRAKKDHYAIQFDGFINIPVDDMYTFYTYSDDGSQLFLHDQLVVDNNGSHSARKKQGKIALQKGLHPIKILYFEDYEGEILKVSYSSNQMEEQLIPSNNFFTNRN